MTYEDRDYQRMAVEWLSTHKRGILQAPAGVGKTRTMALALNRVIESRPRAEKVKLGWIAHTIEAKQQAQSALNDAIENPSKVDIRIECAASETDWSDRDVLVVDEVHWSTCDQWYDQIVKCDGARYGLSATPFSKSDALSQKLLDMFGGNVFVIEREHVKESLASARVIVLNDTDAGLQIRIDSKANAAISRRERFWKGQRWELEAQCKWQACMEIGIAGNHARNSSVINLAIQHKTDHVLILVNNIEHGEILQQQIPGSHLCFSKMGKKLRRETIEKFKSGEIGCILATSLADEAIDIPIANVLILVSGGRSEIRTVQRTGRVLRKTEGKDSAIIYDFADNYHPMAANHFKKRLSIYKKLNYKIL